MVTKKVFYGKKWIIFVVNNHKYLEIHSSGKITQGKDDRATNKELLNILIDDAINNRLHSQQPVE